MSGSGRSTSPRSPGDRPRHEGSHQGHPPSHHRALRRFARVRRSGSTRPTSWATSIWTTGMGPARIHVDHTAVGGEIEGDMHRVGVVELVQRPGRPLDEPLRRQEHQPMPASAADIIRRPAVDDIVLPDVEARRVHPVFATVEPRNWVLTAAAAGRRRVGGHRLLLPVGGGR